MREVGDKGVGLVANRGIKMGQVVLAENPVMLVNFQPANQPLGEILNQFKKLNQKQKSEYLKLGHHARGGVNRILAIFSSNCVSVRLTEDEDDWRGIYCKFSKTNHSCAPNCVVNFSTKDREMKLVASRNIEKGEEIVINYLDPYRGKKHLLRFDRMRALKNLWHFTCICEICNLTGQKLARNETIKMNIHNLESKQAQFMNMGNTQNAKNSLTLELAILDLMGKLGSEMTREVPDCLMRCYQFGRVLQIHGVRMTQNMENFRRSAMDIAVKLGESYVRRCKEREEEVDRFIAHATKTLVEERKNRVMDVVILWETEMTI
eukprot:GFUD01039067.1.p1 GENE.GFUD01039067.1~~GFUD01039067.1.p1  ORF type:complete len:320 (-),score=103.20 GFUD01039067.1:73-1032(-)